MWIVKLEANPNGSHNDHRADHITIVPDGWATIPDDFTVPATFPFVDIEAEEVTNTREVEVEKEVTDEDGNTKVETVTEEREYTMMTVTRMTEGILPDHAENVPDPTEQDRYEAQIMYTAMMTDTLLEV